SPSPVRGAWAAIVPPGGRRRARDLRAPTRKALRNSAVTTRTIFRDCVVLPGRAVATAPPPVKACPLRGSACSLSARHRVRPRRGRRWHGRGRARVVEGVLGLIRRLARGEVPAVVALQVRDARRVRLP